MDDRRRWLQLESRTAAVIQNKIVNWRNRDTPATKSSLPLHREGIFSHAYFSVVRGSECWFRL